MLFYCIILAGLLALVERPGSVKSQTYIGHATILRNNEYDNPNEQTIVDRNSIFTQDGFVIGWRFYSKWQNWFDPPLHISLEVWRCSVSVSCDVTPRHQTFLVLDQTLGDTLIEVPLPTPLQVSAGDCLGYSNRGNYGMIPFDTNTVGNNICHIDDLDNANTVEPRQYSYQAMFVQSYTEPGESLLTGQYYNTKHEIASEGHNVLIHNARSHFTCAGICMRTKCMSFSYTVDTKTCACSEDNAYPYTVVQIIE